MRRQAVVEALSEGRVARVESDQGTLATMQRRGGGAMPGRALGWRTRFPVIAYAFVILVLVILAIAPSVIAQRATAGSRAIQATFDPAQDLVAELRFLLLLQVAEYRAFRRSRDPQDLADYREARVAEQEIFERLTPIVDRMSPMTVELSEGIRDASARMHSVADALLSGDITDEAAVAQLPQIGGLADSTLAATNLLQNEIERRSVERFEANLAEAERAQMVALILGLVAVLAVIAVGWFARFERELTRQLTAAVGEQTRLRRISERHSDQLERVTASRARLMRGFSHDVKNPLGAADGFLQLLEEGVHDHLTEEQNETVGKSRRSIKAALDLIEDLLGLARAQTDGIELHRAPMDVAEVAREAAEEYRAQAKAKHLALAIEPPRDIPRIESDARRVRQVLGNLIANAVKYTDEGGIMVEASVRSDGGAPGSGRWVAVDVRDSGRGIPHDQARHLFREFSRLETTPDTKGAGIGLFISHQIANALGGDITVKSEVGKGSTFTLWLPAPDEVSGRQPAAAQDSDVGGSSIRAGKDPDR
ncbi:MAG: hypothetical protein GEU90_04300 [Gemmatimonas sp.]|nr:hypothetical protein [Gemmatimonas sp.]